MSTDPMPDDPRISAAWTNLIGSAVRTGQIRIVDDRPTDPIDLDAVQARNHAAHDHVAKLCRGEEDWTMLRIPAQPERDSDLVISAALADVPGLLAEVRRLRGDLVVLGADRDILDQKDSAHEGELGDLRAKLSAADAEVDELRRVADAARRWVASISMAETTAEADLVLALNALDGEKAVWVRDEH